MRLFSRGLGTALNIQTCPPGWVGCCLWLYGVGQCSTHPSPILTLSMCISWRTNKFHAEIPAFPFWPLWPSWKQHFSVISMQIQDGDNEWSEGRIKLLEESPFKGEKTHLHWCPTCWASVTNKTRRKAEKWEYQHGVSICLHWDFSPTLCLQVTPWSPVDGWSLLGDLLHLRQERCSRCLAASPDKPKGLSRRITVNACWKGPREISSTASYSQQGSTLRGLNSGIYPVVACWSTSRERQWSQWTV